MRIEMDITGDKEALRALSGLEKRSSRRRAVRAAMKPALTHLSRRMKAEIRAAGWPRGVAKAVGRKTRNKGDLTLGLVGVRGRQRVEDTNRQPGQRTHRLAGNVGHDEEYGRGRPRAIAVRRVADGEARATLALFSGAMGGAVEDEAQRAAARAGVRRAGGRS